VDGAGNLEYLVKLVGLGGQGGQELVDGQGNRALLGGVDRVGVLVKLVGVDGQDYMENMPLPDILDGPDGQVQYLVQVVLKEYLVRLDGQGGVD
jgi:hypothetical protein